MKLDLDKLDRLNIRNGGKKGEAAAAAAESPFVTGVSYRKDR